MTLKIQNSLVDISSHSMEQINHGNPLSKYVLQEPR